jgi:hypothetical protein
MEPGFKATSPCRKFKDIICGTPTIVGIGIFLSACGTGAIIEYFPALMKAIGRGGDTMHVMIPEFVALAFLAVQVVAFVQILVKACDCCGDIKCCNCFGALFGGIWMILLSVMNILLILVTVLATALLFLAIFIGAANEVDESMVDAILTAFPTIIDSLPSEFGSSLNDFLDRTNMPKAADLDGDDMVTDATVTLGGFVALTLGHFLVLLGFSAGYFGFGARDEARLAAVGVASETTPLKK